MEIEFPITSVKLGEYEFHVGDKVITIDGIVGKIIGFCCCDECAKRGFFEPFWEDRGGCQFMTKYDYENGFAYFHRIGKYRFNQFDKAPIESRISKLNKELEDLRSQLATINAIEAEEAASGTR